MKVTKEQFRAIHKAIQKKINFREDIVIDSSGDTFSGGIDYMDERYKKAFEEIGKLLEEVEELGLE